ncbi:MAG TPA: diguanylate cyclase [Tepidisphaeraceae bacterium]
MALTLAISALFQIHSYCSARRMGEIGRRDAHVRDVLADLVMLRTAVQDAVIGQSGYLLKGEPEDLQLYRRAAVRVPELLAEVRELTADDPVEAKYVRGLVPDVERQLEDLKKGLDVPRQLGAGAASVGAGIDAEPDLRLKDQIRPVIDQMIAQQQQVHAACLAETQAASSAQARSLLFASFYRVFVLLAGCTLILRQQARQRQAEQLCRQSEAFFRNAFDHAATGMALADPSGRWVKVNGALCEMLGYAADELLRTTAASIMNPQDLEKERTAVEELNAGRVDGSQMETRFIHKDGHTVWALVTQSLVRDERGRPQTFIAQIQDITERKQAEDRLRHQSLHDALTGLPNRLLLNERIQRGLERANQDPDYRLAVLFLDLDGFKRINDSLGHAAGDELLTTVAERLRQCVRGGDSVADRAGEDGFAGTARGAGNTAARLAGDEFTVLLDGLRTPADAERVAERILRELAKPVTLGGRPIRTGASIGIVYGDGRRYTSAPQLLADADTALYQAKAAGRGRYVVFDADEQQQSTLASLPLASNLRPAI